ncbi:MAG: hypothetical protein HDS79_01460 [Bacteroidales bacterium]|nr:hypothetical protein [Bacteroidales bacterium]
MKKQTLILGLICLCGLGIGSCSKYTTQVSKSSAYTNYETVCLGAGHNGMQTLRVWGRGATEGAAIEQAMKNALYDVIFKGTSGSGECHQRALVTEVNARERYNEYFTPFFADGGEYQKFVHEEKGGKASRLQAKGGSLMGYGIVVTVNREALRQQLINDGVLSAH